MQWECCTLLRGGGRFRPSSGMLNGSAQNAFATRGGYASKAKGTVLMASRAPGKSNAIKKSIKERAAVDIQVGPARRTSSVSPKSRSKMAGRLSAAKHWLD